jgi:hypothetical protein
VGDEEAGVGTVGEFAAWSKALEEATNFVNCCIFPNGTFAAFSKFRVFSDLACVGIEGVTVEGKVMQWVGKGRRDSGSGGVGSSHCASTIGSGTMMVNRFGWCW